MHGLYNCFVMVSAQIFEVTIVTAAFIYYLSSCLNGLVVLTSTPPRVYRQAATLTGLQLVTSFISVANTLGAQRETTRRQLDAEKKKQTEGPRVESLNKRFSMTHDKITILEQMMRKIFQG